MAQRYGYVVLTPGDGVVKATAGLGTVDVLFIKFGDSGDANRDLGPYYTYNPSLVTNCRTVTAEPTPTGEPIGTYVKRKIFALRQFETTGSARGNPSEWYKVYPKSVQQIDAIRDFVRYWDNKAWNLNTAANWSTFETYLTGTLFTQASAKM